MFSPFYKKMGGVFNKIKILQQGVYYDSFNKKNGSIIGNCIHFYSNAENKVSEKTFFKSDRKDILEERSELNKRKMVKMKKTKQKLADDSSSSKSISNDSIFVHSHAKAHTTRKLELNKRKMEKTIRARTAK